MDMENNKNRVRERRNMIKEDKRSKEETARIIIRRARSISFHVKNRNCKFKI